MAFSKAAVVALLTAHVSAFPSVARSVGMDPHVFRERGERLDVLPKRDDSTCPFNPDHVPAAPITTKYPYCGAAGGLPGKQNCVNNLVPADGDTAHEWQAPTAQDIRGPCPGLNTAANHNFLARDGITNFAELVDAQQNVYGVGYDLAVLLAVLGVGFDGDPVTTKLSIGCDATSRTSLAGNGPELGLDGHNKFEGDSSLTRNDYFLADGDNYSFNQTLYKEMLSYCKGNCGLNEIAAYRYARYQASLNENGNFYFGPKSLLLFGAASFLYELFPSLGNAGPADVTTMNYFFQRQELPPAWYSRATPYSIADVAIQIGSQYQLHPVAFGANTGAPNTFFGFGENGLFTSSGLLKNSTQAGISCALYQLATGNVPASIGGGSGEIPQANLEWAATMLNPLFAVGGAAGKFGCPLNFNSA